ncbi:zinc-binding dehydrogenase [Companilactobacillus ginsenosidimutans]|uniref:NADPH:quinone reductase n=1 Tax=Companilactobacillus ginsenosidimutans TaxID=1007676 RepID=A0A0H4R117_9LACO|nr:zinc-binding dehydrogenase [Companilactobacillus ginsenosidimutans]AKP67400.1 NADPH:quinone reductase [Companilactobacillus ginsenosidimutans]
MRAVVVNKAGGPEALEIEERPIPKANKYESVMKIYAFPVHRYEVLTRQGGSPSVKFPRVIGVEAVGEVFETTEDSDLEVGQKVVTLMGGFGREFDGSYEEYALVPNNQLYPVEYYGAWEILASLPETFYTAFGALKATHLQQGDHLLVRGGTTGVGMAAIELAKSLGLKVTGTTRHETNLAMIKKVAADEAILDTNGVLETDQEYDGIIDMIGAPVLENTLSHLKLHKTCTSLGMVTGEWKINNFDPFEYLSNKYLTFYDSTEVNPDMVEEMFRIINANDLQIPIAKVFKLSDIQEAHKYVMESPRNVGQVIVTNQ